MWKIIYNIVTIPCFPFFLLYGLTKNKIRKNLLERLFPATQKNDMDKAVWIHAASIGEAVIADNLMQYLAKDGRVNTFLITTNTHYTKELLLRKTQMPKKVFALPFDLIFSVKRFLKHGLPRCLLIIETEIWPNLIWESKKRGIPVIIINGRISDSTFKNYLKLSFFMKNVFSHVDHVFAQSEEHRERFIRIGMNPSMVTTTGNIKYFRSLNTTTDTIEKKKIISFGSIKEKELVVIYETIKNIKNIFPDHRIFIAPRELHLTSTIEKDLLSSFSVTRYSVLKNETDSNAEVVVVDTIGDLLYIYGQSKVAFVGGSLAPYGGQNILEPLFFSTPVLFGPHVENFKDIAQRVLQYKAGMIVHNANELTKRITDILKDDNLRHEMKKNARLVIEEQQQVMQKTIELVTDIIETN